MGRAYKDEGALSDKDSSWGVLRPEFQGPVTMGELLLPSGFTPVTLRSMKWASSRQTTASHQCSGGVGL